MLELAAKAVGQVCGEGWGGEQRPSSTCWILLRLLGREREEKGCVETSEHFCSQGLHLVFNPETLRPVSPKLSRQKGGSVLWRTNSWTPCDHKVTFTDGHMKIRLNIEHSSLTSSLPYIVSLYAWACRCKRNQEKKVCSCCCSSDHLPKSSTY